MVTDEGLVVIREMKQFFFQVMATYQISPPQSFNFARPDEWPRWIRCFERFREALGLKSKESANQVNTLMYCM